MDAVVLALSGVLPLMDKTSGTHLAMGCAAAPAAVLHMRSPCWGCASAMCPQPACPVRSSPRSLSSSTCPHSPCLPKASPCCRCLWRLFGRQAAGTSPASTQGFPLGAFCWQDAHCNVWFCKWWMHCKRLMCHLDLSQLLVTRRISSCNLWVSTHVSSDFAIWVMLLLKLGVSNKLNKTMKTCFLR